MKKRNKIIIYRLIKKYEQDIKQCKSEEINKMNKWILNNLKRDYKESGGKRRI